MISQMDGVKKNHVFTVRSKDSNYMTIQEYSGAPPTRQLLVLRAYREADWRPLFKLQQLKPPGLPDIKWNELYAKWGKFVPEDRKAGLKYFTEKPPESVKKAIAEQTAGAKAARSKRSRGGSNTGKKEVAKSKEKNSASKKLKK